MEEQYSMVQECTDSYRVEEKGNKGIEIHMKIPKRFENLWICKLSDLRTTMEEIKEMEKDE
ncbi:hypothetical protein [Candidatus Neptunichlamydia sp. REUL1]|uniref:hypothetical protein n=1 Tax=Candidatus Neptunichlamydia sp. REUL1 TaxID=3064277 RepID=UPI0029306995|nr:hypothetical protein [Candidatus Neptunochlamydia sp. REUL1]